MIDDPGSRLRALRRRKGLSQQVLADLAGLSVSYVQKLERGQRAMDNLRTVGRLAEALRVDAVALLGDRVDVEIRLSRPTSPPPGGRRDEAAPLLEVVERLARVLDRRMVIDSSIVDGLEAVTAAHAGQYARRRPDDLLGPAQRQVDRLAAALDGSLLPSWRTRLMTLLATRRP